MRDETDVQPERPADDAPAADNPLAASEERDARIRERAYHLWEADGCPAGQDANYWERARELDAIYSSAGAGQLPIETQDHPEEAEIQENLGEFPGRFADQGEQLQTPMPRSKLTETA